jgi:chemotaxis protein histidine kinase CheA
VAELQTTLRRLSFSPLDEVLQPVMERMAEVAAGLGRAAPRFLWPTDRLLVHPKLGAALHDSFLHLITNSLDHGIEPSEERRALGKPATGTLRLDVEQDSDSVRLSLSDDGRGLNLAALRAMLVHGGRELLASVIFEPGATSREEVSMTSGRGVGLDAVRRALGEHGVGVRVVTASSAAVAAFVAMAIEISIPRSLAVVVADSGSCDVASARPEGMPAHRPESEAI